MSEGKDPHHSHIDLANKVFRDCGFSIAAMQYPRSPEALVGLKRFNGLKDDVKTPFAWGYFPNSYVRDNWAKYYGNLPAKA